MSAVERSLEGKLVVVTGAAQGIGAETSRHLAALGASVVVADRNLAGAEAVSEACRDAGGAGSLAAELDVTSMTSCRELSDRLDGPLHGLVNCAAVFSTITMKPFWEISPEEWEGLMAVNLRGPWMLTTALLPALRSADGAGVVNVVSDAMWIGKEGYLHYVGSKAGLLGMTFAMARELGPFGVRVNAVSPGPVDTEVPRETVGDGEREQLSRITPLRRFGVPGDIASVIAFLLSDGAAFVTGQSLSVNGGLVHR